MNKRIFIAACFLSVLSFVSAQDIMTAPQFFQRVSEKYGTIQDYTANISITKSDEIMTGEIAFQTPNKLRIDFTDPEDQVLVSDGKTLSVYIPKLSVVMKQELDPKADVDVSSMMNQKGLEQLQRSYNIAFTGEGRRLVSLDNNSSEKVTKLILTRKSSREAFREMIVSVTENLIIRRIEGLTDERASIVFDFENMVINQGLPENHFVFDNEASANEITNFLFEPEE